MASKFAGLIYYHEILKFVIKECAKVKHRIMKYSLIVLLFSSIIILGTIAANALLPALK
jgi:hypothetical protein